MAHRPRLSATADPVAPRGEPAKAVRRGGGRRAWLLAGFLLLFGIGGVTWQRTIAARRERSTAAAGHVERSRAATARSDFLAALVEARRALALDPETADVHRLAGYASYRLRRYDDARASLETAVHRNPRDSFALCFLGLVHAEHPRDVGDLVRARSLLEQALPSYRGAEAWYGLGLVALREGRARDAAIALRRAVAIDPGWESGRYRLAEAYRVAGDRAAAAREARIFDRLRVTRHEFERLTQRLGRSPGDVPLRQRLGRLCLETHRYREAFDVYVPLARNAPSPEAFAGLSHAARGMGQPELAAQVQAAARSTLPTQ